MKPKENEAELTPGYVRLHESGELARRAEAAIASLRTCRMCPRNCGVNRLEGETGFCKTGRRAKVSSCFAHLGEEDCLRGWNGSGTIFFCWCNIQCVFCQNYDISQHDSGEEVTPEQLARLMLRLQEAGCHNINTVTPSHVVAQILESLPLAAEAGLRLPIVYNTGGFDSLETLRLLDGVVDIYMPDFKYWNPERSKLYLRTSKYPEAARAAIKEMHRQVGDLRINDKGLATRGLLIRHLVMPGGLEDTREIMRFLASELSTDTYVNLMPQYHPDGEVSASRFPELDRGVSSEEMAEAYQVAQEARLHRFDERRQVFVIRRR
jgi:putative pyruvate formate lyase activating enzyme